MIGIFLLAAALLFTHHAGIGVHLVSHGQIPPKWHSMWTMMPLATGWAGGAGYLTMFVYQLTVTTAAAVIVGAADGALGSYLLWLYWREHGPRLKRKASRAAGVVKNLGHRLVVVNEGAAS